MGCGPAKPSKVDQISQSKRKSSPEEDIPEGAEFEQKMMEKTPKDDLKGEMEPPDIGEHMGMYENAEYEDVKDLPAAPDTFPKLPEGYAEIIEKCLKEKPDLNKGLSRGRKKKNWNWPKKTKEGDWFEGTMRTGKRNGAGRLLTKDKTYYYGKFFNGNFTEGVVIKADKSYEFGKFAGGVLKEAWPLG